MSKEQNFFVKTRNALSPDLPVMNSNVDAASRPLYLKELREVGARRLWLAPDRELLFGAGSGAAAPLGSVADGSAAASLGPSGCGRFAPSAEGGSVPAPTPVYDRAAVLASLEENLSWFRRNGLEVGLWIQAFGFGDHLGKRKVNWTRLKSVTGRELAENDAFCPEDPAFMECYLAHVKEMAAFHPDLLMLDDDLCMSVRPGIGCFCDRHMALLEAALGEDLCPEELPEKIFTGGQNRYRDAWYQVMGDTLRRFCQKVRDAVDEIDPGLRVGFCAGYTSWDFEGADAIELTRILAGKNEPFLRFTGAPYWCSRGINRFPGQKQNAVIECARLQDAWCQGSGVEVFAEADSYPRPCYHVNASYIENFDIAMRASGIRSLKYMFDYFSSPDYEKQYLRLHKRNLPLYERIDSVFADKTPAGVRLFRPMHRIQKAQLPEKFVGEGELMRLFFSQSAALLTGLGIPVCYTGNAECGAAFGEDVLALEDISSYKKLILDLPAARLLEEKGIDTGLAGAKRAAVPGLEYFPAAGRGAGVLGAADAAQQIPAAAQRLLLSGIGQGAPLAKTGSFYDVQLKEGARAESWFESQDGITVSSYRYHNDTTEFMVLAFDALAAGESSTLFASYCRQNQLMDFVGGAYPYIRGFSEIYSLCAASEDGREQAVLFENQSLDPVFDFEIELGKICEKFELIGAMGELTADKKRIRVTTDFQPSAAMVLQVAYAQYESEENGHES